MAFDIGEKFELSKPSFQNGISIFRLDILKLLGGGKAARSTDLRDSRGAVFGGDGRSGLMASCLRAVKLSWYEIPRCISWEALMVRFGSLCVGEDSAVRICVLPLILARCEDGVAEGVKGK